MKMWSLCGLSLFVVLLVACDGGGGIQVDDPIIPPPEPVVKCENISCADWQTCVDGACEAKACEEEDDCGENAVCNADKKCEEKEVLPPPLSCENPCDANQRCKEGNPNTCVAVNANGCQETVSACTGNEVCVTTNTAAEPASAACGALGAATDCEDECATNEVCYIDPETEGGECKTYDGNEPWAACFDTGDPPAPACTVNEPVCVGKAAEAAETESACSEATCERACAADEVCVLINDNARCTVISELPSACRETAPLCDAGEVCEDSSQTCFTPLD